MSTEQTGRERDLILAPNQSAFIQDETKGIISVYVGPNRTSLANTDRPVVYNPKTRKFEKSTLEQATQEFPLANEGWYIVLENPAVSSDQAHPTSGSSVLPKLDFGRKVNMPGPATFPLWPGQVAYVIEGHRLRSNQYVVVRVYNEDAARQNWGKSMVVKLNADAKTPGEGSKDGSGAVAGPAVAEPPPDLTIGKLYIIKGTDVSFYIPPTGVEVIPDRNGQFIRDAVTLERLEYCNILDENGAKRIVIGPEVVFPEPTETFIEKDGQRKFKATELNDDMGIYVKVIADYEEGGKSYKTGAELFITGRDQRIYYPREEHAVIKYGDRERHYGVVIPDGEARYVLNKEAGKIELVKGPQILLADPRKQVIVQRVLEAREVSLWFPGNAEAQAYNDNLRSYVRDAGGLPAERVMQEDRVAGALPPVRRVVSQQMAGDQFQRGSGYTPPRTLTLDTKYEGAVSISVWAGYAVQISSKTGGAREVVGPAAVLLEYDESLQMLELSTGKPKTTDKLERTCYLRVHHNHVSDIVKIVTKDMVEVEVKLSYRVNFEGDAGKWFTVENYVKFLCDHVRSILRHAGKQVGIEEFNNNSIPIIRDAILGKPADGKRTGLKFDENGMRVYDVEVLGITIGDERIRQMLVQAQHETVRETLEVANQQRRLVTTQRTQQIEQEIQATLAETKQKKLDLQAKEVGKELELTLAEIKSEADAAARRLEVRMAEQAGLTEVDQAELDRLKARQEQEINLAGKQLDQRLTELRAEVQAVVDKAKAISPDMIAALQAFGDKYIAGEAVKAMSPLAILGGKSVADVTRSMLEGTIFGKALNFGNNGHQPGTALAAGPQDKPDA